LQLLDWEARYSAGSERFIDDDDDYNSSGSGDVTRRDFVNVHDLIHGESFISRDHAHQRARVRLAHQTKRPESSSGGLGILWSLVVFAFVFSVVAAVFLRR